jgi:hypothetical protein
MPSYADRLTVQQLIDVVAYLKSLKPVDVSNARDDIGGQPKKTHGP